MVASSLKLLIGASWLGDALAQRQRLNSGSFIPRPLGIPDPTGQTYVFNGQTLTVACEPFDFLSVLGGTSTDNCANYIKRVEDGDDEPCPPGTDLLGSKADFCSGMVPDITYTIIGSTTKQIRPGARRGRRYGPLRRPSYFEECHPGI